MSHRNDYPECESCVNRDCDSEACETCIDAENYEGEDFEETLSYSEFIEIFQEAA